MSVSKKIRISLTEHFEIMRVQGVRPNRHGETFFKLYVRKKSQPRTLVEVSPLLSEAEKTMVKLERLYPCHFLAKEWQSGHKLRLRRLRRRHDKQTI